MADPHATLGVIVGNRDFFPDQLVTEAREDVSKLFDRYSIRPIWVSPEETKLGGVETHAEARKCAELFRKHRDELDGILVVLPNFGDEKGVADVLRLSGLDLPVLIQAYPDDLNQLGVSRRRDGFCGKISVCNNLVQAGTKFSLTSEARDGKSTRTIVRARPGRSFFAVCRVVNGVRGVRLGCGRRATGGVQYGAVQRKDSRAARDQRYHGRSVGDHCRGGPTCRMSEDTVANETGCEIQRLRSVAPGVPPEKLCANGQARRRAGAMDGSRTRWTRRRFNVGRRSSRTSAAMFAR